MAKKPLGGSKGHISGAGVSGRHTTVIEGVDKILRRLSTKEWFDSVQPMQIIAEKSIGGGGRYVDIKRHPDTKFKNTLMLTFKKSGAVQKVAVRAENLETQLAQATADIESTVAREWRGATVNNHLL